MDSAEHKAFAERIMDTMEKLGPEDYEMTIEGAMLATTHWVNYALHEFGVTEGADDVQHTYFLSGNDLQKLGIVAEELLQALDEIDGHGFGRFARNFDEIDRAGFGGRFV